jgi:hypothetical protein
VKKDAASCDICHGSSRAEINTETIKNVLPDRLPDFYVAPPDNSPENQKMLRIIDGVIASHLLACSV